MPLQEFLASYAVQVDEDGARRLQKILDQNRTSAGQLASVFENAYSALKKLKKELSDTAGMKNVLSVIQGNASVSPRVSSALSGLSGGSSGSALAGVSAVAGKSVLSISANLNPAEEALSGFRSRLEAERPRLNVNATGITTAVSSAIAQVRTMMSSVRLTIPVTAKATLDSSGLKAGISGATGASGSGATIGSTYSGSSAGSSRSGSSGSLIRLGIGGRVSRPTMAMIAEEGSPEYVIPTDNDARAVTLLRSLLSELSSSAKKAVLPWLEGEAGSVQEKAGKSAFAIENELLKSSRLLPVSASKTTENDAVKSAADLSGFLSALSATARDGAAAKTETALSSFLSHVSTVLRDQPSAKEKIPSSRMGSLSGLPLSGSLEGAGTSQRSLQQILSEALKESGRFQGNLPRILQEALEESGRSMGNLPRMLQKTQEGIGTSQRNLPRIPPEALEAIQNTLRSVLPGISASTLSQGSSLAGVTDSLSDMRALFSSLVSSARSIFLPPSGSSSPVSNSVQAPVNIHVTAAPGQAEAIGQSLYDVTQRSLLKTLQGVFA